MVPRGTIVPLVTPFDDMDGLDLVALRRMGFVEEAGVHGAMITALTGEGPLLTLDDRYHGIVRGNDPAYASWLTPVWRGRHGRR